MPVLSKILFELLILPSLGQPYRAPPLALIPNRFFPAFKLKDVLNEGNYVDNCVSVKLLNDLNDIPVTQRPIHCTDKRRKNFVVKDKEEGWITEKGNQPGKISKQINNLYGKAYIDFYHEYDQEHPLPHSNRQVDEKSETSSKIMQKKDKHYIIGTLAKNLDVKEAIKEIENQKE